MLAGNRVREGVDDEKAAMMTDTLKENLASVQALQRKALRDRRWGMRGN